jgi:hypothetical protein
MKKIDTRVSDAIAYLSNNISAALAAEVKSLYGGSPLQLLGIDLGISLGGRDDHGDHALTVNTSQRNALRAAAVPENLLFAHLEEVRRPDRDTEGIRTAGG